MKIVCLTDFQIRQGGRWLWDFLPNNQDEVKFLATTVIDQYAKWGKIIRYYPAFIRIAYHAHKLVSEGSYDLVVAWEGKNGFPYALVRRLFNQKSPPFVILSFSIRGPLVHFPVLQKYGMRSVDFITVPTDYERKYYTKCFGMSAGKVKTCPHGIYDLFENSDTVTSGGYIFSGGRSGRDYYTFFKAVSCLDIKVIVNARPFNLRGLVIPDNVKCNDILPSGQYRDLNRFSRFVVVPLQEVHEAVGITAVLYAMAAGKAVIATDVSGIGEYILDGESGILVSPYRIDDLRDAIQYLINNPEITESMGRIGREHFEKNYTFEAFAQRTYKVLQEINTNSSCA